VSKEIQKVAVPAALLIIAAIVFVLPVSQESQVAAANVQISNQQFAAYVQGWSEPEGYFDSDNFISNETSYQHVVGELRSRVRPGGVYLGVGPDQNFTYIVHTKPTLAVIVDIRRQNVLEHLLFKALFEQAAGRAEYLSLLFAKEKPVVARGAGLQDILKAVRQAPSSEESFQRHFKAVRTILIDKYPLRLSEEDLKKIEYTYRAFWEENLDLRFSSIGRGNAMNYPTFESLLMQTDREGHQQNYLSSDELFDWLKKFEAENRVIPIVGDFGGSKAFSEVAGFLKKNALPVSTFYTSNVEFYLFGTPSWQAFMKNVHALPTTEDAVFIRAYFGNYGRSHPATVRGHRSTSMVHALLPFLRDYDGGRIQDYWDVVYRGN
jgi:hypothetical protein